MTPINSYVCAQLIKTRDSRQRLLLIYKINSQFSFSYNIDQSMMQRMLSCLYRTCIAQIYREFVFDPSRHKISFLDCEMKSD